MIKQIAGKKESKQKVYRIMTIALLYTIRIGNSFSVNVQQQWSVEGKTMGNFQFLISHDSALKTTGDLQMLFAFSGTI